MLVEALGLYGARERAGAGSAPEILAWARETGLPYGDDGTPWCGLFMAVVARRAGWAAPARPLWARDWLGFGRPAAAAGLGDVLVFARRGGGHVGLYVGEDARAFHVLGGNQGDAVSIARIARARLLGARRPAWRVAEPANVRPVRLSARGALSADEA